MNCFNGEKYLKKAIDSVLEQTYPNWEIIFWDNASTDGSRQIVLSYNDPRIKYFREETTVSLGEARQKAIKKIMGEYLCVLDVDDYFLPDKIETQLNIMVRNPSVVMSYSNLFFLNERHGKTAKYIQNHKTNYQGEIFGKLIQSNWIYLSTIMINCKLAGQQLYFDENYKFVEEYELFLRLSLIGKILFINSVLGIYRLHDNNFITKEENYAIAVEERINIIQKYEKEIELCAINDKKLKDHIYESYALFLLRENKTTKIEKVLQKIDNKKSSFYFLIMMLTKLRLAFLYKFYYSLKKKMQT